jgi:hypothetical protein
LFEHPIVLAFAAMLLLVGALQQIGTGLYYLGCFRRYNQVIDTLARWFDTVDPIKMTETIRDFFLISIALTLLIAVVV